MIKRKILVLTLSLACALSLASCSSRDPEPADSSSAASEGTSSSSTAISAPVTYTLAEAAANNAKIKSSDIELIQFTPGKGSETVVLHTTEGDIEIELYRDQAPLAVDNFITHAKNGYYNGMNFYKAVNNYLIQSGSPADKAPESIYKDETGRATSFADEFNLSLWNFRGALVMQNRGEGRPDTNTSEFFIVQAGPVIDDELISEMKDLKFPDSVIAKYQEIGGIPGFDWRHTVFGMVTSGMDVVDAIASSDTDDFGVPVETILIESITVK